MLIEPVVGGVERGEIDRHLARRETAAIFMPIFRKGFTLDVMPIPAIGFDSAPKCS
ncbi:hypothetical protein [Mycobacterium sp. 050134]|uniref:hypothetical protein n=1 Tax=Mycobacterium sp. 050134 TaxID=3096111 RepID=UPI002EDAD7B1